MAIHTEDPLSVTFAALADPTRRAMLAKLARGAADVSELAAPFGLSQPTISKHLKVLEHAGLVATTRDGQRRPRAIVAKPLRDLDRWLDAYRQLWEDRFASLDDYLTTLSPPTAAAKSSRRRRRSK